ncbi:GrpB family protein [Marinomonas sp. TW1]|uniref:GrpB family protein n=1 Tax=Marinomonas sp. TW1 TaxID=1561203 RepID=UPI0007AFB346|nr:GrpB family protein [Marinomonas sp. TW1]KZN14895.1 hypothetical protein OA79_04185 [Marinomonas sp. TW1]
MRIIEVVEYNDDWPRLFEIEKQLILSSLPIKKLWVHHIGSTAVSGLAAKPIIDILLEVEEIEALDGCNELFESIGYECKGEFGISGRRYFQKGGYKRSHQIHAFGKDSENSIRHLAFKEYLIAHPAVAEEYAELKLDVAKHCNNDIGAYCDGKDEFVTTHEKHAVEWYKNA